MSPFTYSNNAPASNGKSQDHLFQNDLGPSIQRGPVTKPEYPSSPFVRSAVNQTQPLLQDAHYPPPSNSAGSSTEVEAIQQLETREEQIRRPVLYQDSGIRLGAGIEIEDMHVPPVYTAS
jgi:hypothetical protein